MASRSSVPDGQRPLPFKGGLPKARTRPAKTWKLADGQRAKVCPICGCDELHRCTLRNEDGEEAACVPAGAFGQRVCSGCKQVKLFEAGAWRSQG